jgi:hypothetical protein
MRQGTLGTFAAAILAFAIPAASASAAQHAASTSKARFSGNLCSIPSAGELTAAHISEPCTKGKTVSRRPRKSPLGGTAGSIMYSAHWGVFVTGPQHVLSIIVTKLTGSGNALKLAEQTFKLKIKSKPFQSISAGGDGTVETEPISCKNPPTGICTKGTLLGQVGPYVILIDLADHPPTNPAIPEDSIEITPEARQAQAEAYAQELQAPLFAIGKSVAAKL